MPYAVIDIGTNTLILLIAKANKKSMRVLYDQAAITRLGQGLTENHFFLSEAMNRTLEVLKKFKEICAQYKVKKIFAVGTAAFRNAANAEVFINKIKKDLKIGVRVLSGEEEAENVFYAAFQDFGKEHKQLIVIDIGGGSTEIISGPYTNKKTPKSVISLPVGSVRLTELYVKTDPISRENFEKLLLVIRNTIRDHLDDFYPETFNPQDYTMIATAGTATTLATLGQRLSHYKPDAVHGFSLSKKDLEGIIDSLAAKTIQERQKMPGLEPLRADVILAGAILLRELMAFFKKDQTLISDRGLRYGVFGDKFIK